MDTRKNRRTEAVLTCTHNLCFEQIFENSQKNSTEMVNFTAMKYRCLLHGNVCVMHLCNIGTFVT